jgi:hypothetical protein
MNKYFILLAVIAIIAFVYMQRESFNNASASAVAYNNCSNKLYNLTNGSSYICGTKTKSININNREVELASDVKSVYIIPITSSIKSGLISIESNVQVTPFTLPREYNNLNLYYNNTLVKTNMGNGFQNTQMCNIYTSKD